MKIKDWYMKLPESVKLRAMGNVVMQGNSHLLNNEVESLEQAILAGFNMDQSNEGPLYWAYAINEIRRLPSSYAGDSQQRERIVFIAGMVIGFWVIGIMAFLYLAFRS